MPCRALVVRQKDVKDRVAYFFNEVLRSDRCLSQSPVNKQDMVFSACVSNEPFEQAREGLLLRLQLALLLSERPDIDFE